ncbi:MAG TPA: tetratricopeptide repeat protein [Allosphingosinicella sp.]|nr:tetratricopeptide repeat protein [Allosphingosinicella sp.]HYC80195.1 tetratricopeptide repeat protein [Solirubrobacterales bacterium]
MIPILLALAAVQATAAAPPADAGAEARFRGCTDLVRTDPERAVEMAAGWRVEGGGIFARQCLGLAYVALERWEQAAGVYEQAARDADLAQDPRRADLWVQSGNAWLAAGEGVRAVAAFDAALATPNLTNELRGEVHLDRARALVSLGNAAGAREELDRGLRLVPADPFAWYLSAALARQANDLVRARADIARARQLAPDDPEVALLAGTLAGLAGDMAEAERLYRQVAEGAPDSEAGRTARSSLETLREVEVPAPAATPPPPQPAPR